MPVPIVAARRSPFAVADGVLARWHPVDLVTTIAAAALTDAGVGADAIGGVWVGCDEPVGAQGANLAAAVVLAAGWPAGVSGQVVDAGPVSGFAALAAAADAVAAGRVSTAVVVGVRSASIVTPGASALGRLYGRPWGDGPAARYAPQGGLVPPIVAADRAAVTRGLDAADQDAWGRASRARRPTGVPAVVTIGAKPGDGVAVQRGTPIDGDVLRELPDPPLEPIFDADGTTTAAAYAPPADGCTVLVLGTGASEPIAELCAVQISGSDPLDPTDGVSAVVEAAGLDPVRIDHWEIAEPSASTGLVVIDQLGLDPARVNPHGGTIAVGDAGAAEELRLVVDGLHHGVAGSDGVAVRAGGGAAAVAVWRHP